MTVQPELLKSFCECYDLKKHATKIFQDIVNSLGAYVQSLFVNSQMSGPTTSGNPLPVAQGQPPAILAGMPVGPGISPQPGFFSRGVWLPVVVTFSRGQAKSNYLEMLDKIEPPIIPDGFGISVAYACLLDIIRSLSIIIEGTQSETSEQDVKNDFDSNETTKIDKAKDEHSHKETSKSTLNEEQNKLHIQLINSSWCGLLAALSPLLEARYLGISYFKLIM